MALAIGNSLLRRSVQVNRTGDGAVLRIDDRGVGRAVTKDVNSPKPWFDFESTAAPCALALAISPTGFKVSRSKMLIRPEVPSRGM